MQGLAPTFIGTLSDDGGRRTAYITAFTIYAIANIGLALQNSYPALMVLRCVQSAGSSGTVSLANAVVADLVTSAERGTYVSWTSVIPQLGPSIGPIIGGLLAQYVNWHFIFWFLLIITGVVFLPMLVFFPETCRKIVDDGSVPPPKWLRCYTNVIIERRLHRDGKDLRYEYRDRRSKDRHWRFPNPLDAFVLLFRKEVGFPLIFSALLTSGYYAITVLIPSQFGSVYGFNEVQISLCYIPLGMGSMFAALVRGPVINSRFKHHADRLGISVDKSKHFDLSDFPIERARLEVGFPTLIGAALFIIGFGWLIEARVHLSAPLIFLFFIGFCASATMNTIQVLMVDIYPGKAGTVTASNNLLRCWIGAGATAVVVPMINSIGNGWTGTFFGGLLLVFSPGLLYIMKQGPKWRKVRRQKQIQDQTSSPAPLPEGEKGP